MNTDVMARPVRCADRLLEIGGISPETLEEAALAAARHAKDAEDLREFLLALGLLPDPEPPRRTASGRYRGYERKPPSTRRPNPEVICKFCTRLRPNAGYGWCTACHIRWTRAGRPETGPPPVVSARGRRMAKYESLIENGMTRAEAAREVGIKENRAREYEKALGIKVAS